MLSLMCFVLRPLVPWLLTTAMCLTACVEARQLTRPRDDAQPSLSARRPSAPRRQGLYTAEEALQDALSGHWEYLGTGPWPGIDRAHACVFKNNRVLIVNVYCTVTETQAFRIDVYSPDRGRVRIYAESSAPVSKRERSEYFTFTAESEPPPGPEVSLAPLTLGMSFQELRDYDRRRYEAFLPVCYGGEQFSQHLGGCLGSLSGHVDEWSRRNGAFLRNANADWYRLVHDMRSLATRYGIEPK